MYRHDGQDVFVIDGHAHLWDARSNNWRNKYGESWIKCFFRYHSGFSPANEVWPFEKFCYYGEDAIVDDLFRNGYVDLAILNSTYLFEFYKNGFNTHAQNALIKRKYPERFLLCGSFDPRDEQSGLDTFRQMMSDYPISGLKLYTAEWRADSSGWRLNDPRAYKYFELAQKMGIKNVHVHKGPTVYPLNIDAFDVRDVDHVATDFPNLNFIVEHVGLPRLDDFCWIAVQESNVYAGLAVASALIHTRPRYFAEIMTELLYWLGPDRILFGSDYAIWHPKWIIEQFMDLELSEDLASEANNTLSLEVKRKIMAENCARLYGIDIAQQSARLGLPAIAEPVAVA